MFNNWINIMVIVLYEPSDRGHRLTVLNYVIGVLNYSGHKCKTVVMDFTDRPWQLFCNEVGTGNSLFYMMLDGRPLASWINSHLVAANGGCFYAIYYLYNNLLSLPNALVWAFLISTGRYSKIFVSDKALLGSILYPRGVLSYLPDPWRREDFPVVDKNIARAKLEIPQGSLVFLTFGEVDERKGADFLTLAMAGMDQCDVGGKDIVLLFGGRMSMRVAAIIEECKPQLTLRGINCIIHNYRIDELQVSTYFYAADYVVCAYPKSFTVSSGTVTRALAANIPIISSSHGATGSLVAKYNLGFTYEAANIDSFRRAIRMGVYSSQAISLDGNRISACQKLASEREFANYKRLISDIMLQDEFIVI